MIPAQRNNRGWSYKPGSTIVRGYDTSAVFREDCLERIKHLQMEVDADLKELARMRREYATAEEQLRQRKKEFGWID